MEKEKIIKLASIVIGLLITILLIWFALRFVSRGRAASIEVGSVTTDNITENSATIKFNVLASGESGITPVVQYGASATTLNLLAPATCTNSDSTNNKLVCEVALNLLEAKEKAYYFVLKIGDVDFDNNGVPWTFSLSEAGSGLISTTPTPTPTSVATPTVTVAVSPTGAITPTPTSNLKPLSEIKDLNDCTTSYKNADGKLKDGVTAQLWGQCQKQNE